MIALVALDLTEIRGMEKRKARIITTKLTMEWATLPPDRHASWALRLSDVRRFAPHVANFDPRTEVPWSLPQSPAVSTKIGSFSKAQRRTSIEFRSSVLPQSPRNCYAANPISLTCQQVRPMERYLTSHFPLQPSVRRAPESVRSCAPGRRRCRHGTYRIPGPDSLAHHHQNCTRSICDGGSGSSLRS